MEEKVTQKVRIKQKVKGLDLYKYKKEIIGYRTAKNNNHIYIYFDL